MNSAENNSVEKSYAPSNANTSNANKSLDKTLIDNGIITPDQLSIALSEQKKSGKPLGEMLVDLGFVSEATLRDSLSKVFGTASIDLSTAIPDPDALSLFPRTFSVKYKVLPISLDREENTLYVAMSDISNIMVLDRMRVTIPSKYTIEPVLAGESEIIKSIDDFYQFELSIDAILNEIETGEIDYNSLDFHGSEYSHPLVRLVNAILVDAVKQGTSDIHLEPEEKFVRIRYRIDGVLHQVRSISKDYWSSIVVRLKVMGNMNIAETHSPQDGRINLKISGRKIDFRVSAQPITHGENIVLRVLDRSKGIVELDKLNLFPENLSKIHLMLARPEGIIIVTGPTGSGKTTTLYSLLNHRNSVGVNIMTLEDPVEYPLDLIRQTDLNDTQKMDFSSGIRSLLRQDPDVILLGEIRDEDTANMAFRAAMTGHQVLTSLHANSALGAVSRLKDIGVSPDVLSGNIIGIIGQRLIRRLCQACKEGRKPVGIERRLLSLPEENGNESEIPMIYEAKGCKACKHTGYKGRFAAIEIVKMDDAWDDLLANNATFSQLKKHAEESDFTTMVDDGIRHVLAGNSSLDEISRVLDLTSKL